MRPYVVRAGDYLAKLAATMRFDADAVWNDPKNKQLRESRDPNVLNPGDVLYVPDVPPAPLKLTRGGSNVYVAKIPTVQVTLGLREGGEPHANETYVIEGLPTAVHGKTDAEGRLTVDVPVTVTELRLTLLERCVGYTLRVGHLDPVETATGLRSRLANLGHYAGLPSLSGDGASSFDEGLDEALLSFAVRSFQLAKALPATGEADSKTRAALLAAHGA